MKVSRTMVFLIAALCLIGFPAAAIDSWMNTEGSPFQVFLETEQGFIAVLNHTYQAGEDTTNFDFRTMGGQEILFPFQRYHVGAEIAERHRVTFAYQPLQLDTQVVFRDSVSIDDEVFPAGTPMNIKYGFPFYRFTYTFDLVGADPDRTIAIGAALQLRNASIAFASADGNLLTVSQNLGPVPAIALYSRLRFPFGLVLTAEATGLWASSSIINGATFEFEGSILDASLRAGYELANGSELFGVIRYFGGTAVGTSQYPDRFWTEGVENYTSNILSTLTVSAGISLR